MDIAIMVGQLLLSLSLLVFLHELGHYMAARAFGIRVEKFYIFFDAFGAKLFSFKKGDTEYGIGWLPLGGYVKIAGMIDESMDKDQLAKEPEPDEFRAKPAWQRFIVMIGGIVMNVIFGILFMALFLGGFKKDYIPVEEVNKDGIYVTEFGAELGFKDGDKLLSINENTPPRFADYQSVRALLGSSFQVERNGQPVTIEVPSQMKRLQAKQPTAMFSPRQNVVIDGFTDDSPAEKAGLQEGDMLLSVGGDAIESFTQLTQAARANKDQRTSVLVKRGEENKLLISPIDSVGRLGISVEIVPTQEMKNYTFFKSLGFGAKDAVNDLMVNLIGFGAIFRGEVKAQDALVSPIGMAAIFGSEWNWARFWRLTAMISIILAFMNILPIPALDGGHMVFLTIEMITGKPVNDKVLEVAQIIGMVILFSLMIFIFGNDILKLIRG